MTTDDPTHNPTDPPEVQPVIGPRLTPAGLRVAAGFLEDSAEGEDADDLRGAAELLRALADVGPRSWAQLLRELAGLLMAGLRDHEPSRRAAVFGLISAERERQASLWGSGPMPQGRELAILMEEVGEVARALQGEGDLRDELVQVAAVCVRWLEAMQDPPPSREDHGWRQISDLEDEHYWAHLERQAAIQLHPVFVRDMLADPRLIGQAGEDWPDGVAADAVKHARALIARLKGDE